jgi:acetylornithine deacetylase/succinyl-diaminopimelate desuccinylase-like protein
MGARPTLDVNGIYSGYTGDGSKTVLPSSAHAKISMRLVPDQDCHTVYKQLKDYLEKISPPTVKVNCSFAHGSSASIVNYNIPAMQAALESYEQVFGIKPVSVREGGSIPVVSLFKDALGIETILMGFGLPDDRIHAPNERFYLPNFYKGLETVIRFVDSYSRIS